MGRSYNCSKILSGYDFCFPTCDMCIKRRSTSLIEAAIDKIIADNEDKVAEYRGGKDKLFGFFVGQTMKAMQGKANPAVVNQILKDKLG